MVLQYGNHEILSLRWDIQSFTFVELFDRKARAAVQTRRASRRNAGRPAHDGHDGDRRCAFFNAELRNSPHPLPQPGAEPLRTAWRATGPATRATSRATDIGSSSPSPRL